jgi:dihydroxyacetone kinase-like protein
MALEKINVDQFKKMLGRIRDALERDKNRLSQLDSHIGDGDHGFGMANGFRIGYEQIAHLEHCQIEGLLKGIGTALIKEVGGVSGTIFGFWFLGMATASKNCDEVGLTEFTTMFEQGLAMVQRRGGAVPGDKTMVDALHPVVLSLKRSLAEGTSLVNAFHQAAAEAQRGSEATINMIGKHGRAKYFREKSVGFQDAGATTIVVIMTAMSDFASQPEAWNVAPEVETK